MRSRRPGGLGPVGSALEGALEKALRWFLDHGPGKEPEKLASPQFLR